MILSWQKEKAFTLPKLPTLPAVDRRSLRLSAILDDVQVAGTRKVENAGMSQGQPARCTGTTARVLGVSTRSMVAAVRFWLSAVNVGEDRDKAAQRGRRGRGEVGARGHDDLVARLEAEGGEGKL